LTEQLTLFAADTHASLSPLPGSDEARKMTATSGLNLVGSWLNSGPLGSLEKTLLVTSAWASMTCFLTWRDKVTPAGRLLFQLAPLAHRTDETGSGLWPTPMSQDTIERKNESYIARRESKGLPMTLANEGRSARTLADAKRLGQPQQGQPIITSDCAPESEGQANHAFAVSQPGKWRAEPNVGRVANGVSRRVDRLKALGNAVVPQIPEMIGRAILAAEKETA
jgi:hypothetical protein